jgi:homoserine O-acetyltransferase/O-succinyltransferase
MEAHASPMSTIFATVVALAVGLFSFAVAAAEYPAPKQGEWIARDFKFHTDEILPELRIHYATVGNSSGIPVVVLHGTGGSSARMLSPGFAGTLFGPGQPLRCRQVFHHHSGQHWARQEC